MIYRLEQVFYWNRERNNATVIPGWFLCVTAFVVDVKMKKRREREVCMWKRHKKLPSPISLPHTPKIQHDMSSWAQNEKLKMISQQLCKELLESHTPLFSAFFDFTFSLLALCSVSPGAVVWWWYTWQKRRKEGRKINISLSSSFWSISPVNNVSHVSLYLYL